MKRRSHRRDRTFTGGADVVSVYLNSYNVLKCAVGLQARSYGSNCLGQSHRCSAMQKTERLMLRRTYWHRGNDSLVAGLDNVDAKGLHKGSWHGTYEQF